MRGWKNNLCTLWKKSTWGRNLKTGSAPRQFRSLHCLNLVFQHTLSWGFPPLLYDTKSLCFGKRPNSQAVSSCIPAVFENSSAGKNDIISIHNQAKIAEQPNKQYSEKEVNQILPSMYEYFPTIKRYLLAYGFMNRTKDCAHYWLT